MTNGWTGGQYSLVRVVLACYLAVHFMQLLPWATELFATAGVLPAAASPLLHLFPNLLAVSDSAAMVTGLLIAGLLLTVALALGIGDRLAALGLWYVWACLLGRNPLIMNPSLPFVGWLLVLHAVLPPAPWGSWRARGRPNPAGDWQFPPALFAAAWIVMALAYSYSGVTKLVSPSWVDGSALGRVLENPLARATVLRDALVALPAPMLRLGTGAVLMFELGFAPLALIRGVRPWIWTGMLALHVGLLMLIDFADLSVGMIVWHLFTFDPAWIPTKRARVRLLYDADGAVGHRLARLVLAEDRDARVTLAPLTSLDLDAATSGRVAVVTADGQRLVRCEAVRAVLRHLGGYWTVLATVLLLVPTPWRDAAYDWVAGRRRRRPATSHVGSWAPAHRAGRGEVKR